jgi:hypothetical protein
MQSRQHRLIGLWLAALALCALNFQSLQHYQPRMLLGASLCSTSDSRASSDGQPAQHRADCGLCCAQGQPPLVPGVVMALATTAHAVYASAAPISSPALLRPWSPSRPRGPPAVA